MENKNKQPDNHIEYFAHKIAYVVIVLLLLELILASVSLWKVQLQISKDLSIALMPIHKQIAQVPADWKTYTHNEYGFEVKIPTDWETDAVEGSICFASPDSLKRQEYDFTGPVCDFGFSDESDPFGVRNTTTTTAKKINGIDFTFYTTAGVEGIVEDIHHYEVTHNNKIYNVYFYYNELETQIMSTFKFTK